MVNEVNKVFGRDFIVAYFVPSLIYIAANMGLLHAFGMQPNWLRIDPADPLKDTTFIALLTLAGSFCLMSVNRLVFRILEGYWLFDLGTYLSFIQRWRFRKLHARITELSKGLEQNQNNDDMSLKEKELDRLLRQAAQRFPRKENLVLFTSFGNAVRAFEDYSRTMYSFESINGWSRLNAAMPKDFREMLGSIRAMTDLWVNIWFLSLVFIVEYLAIIFLKSQGAHYNWILSADYQTLLIWILRRIWYHWILGAGIVAAFLASWQARVAAEQWGEWVKGAFDVFLPVLCRNLGYKRPQHLEEERKLWLAFSQAIVYRDPRPLEQLDSFRDSSVLATSGCKHYFFRIIR